MVLPRVFSNERERIIASFDFVNLITGQGVIALHPFICWNGSINTSLLNSRIINSNSTTGIIGEGLYFFETNNYTKQTKIEGDAYLSGYADFNANDIDFTAEIFVISGGETISLGTVDWNDETEYTTNSLTYVLKKTFIINDYVNKIITQQKRDSNSGSTQVKYIYFYEGGATADMICGTNSTTYQEIICLNTNQKKYVIKIEMWERTISGFGQQHWIKEQDIYSAILDNYEETSISDEISSETFTTDQTFSIKIPLTTTNIKKGERIRIRLNLTATSGGIVVDPPIALQSNPSLKFHLTFKIDL